MALSVIDQTRLTNLCAARDKLISGQATAAFEFNGQRTEYSRADMNRLDAEITKLETRAVLPPQRQQRRGGAITFRL